MLENDVERRREKNYFYAVLNLPVDATESEIKDKYRSLSLVFHPDRQHNIDYKDSAKAKFLEIQAAYEVLSDPFLREIYDTLGYDGLKLKLPDHFKSLPVDELRRSLREYFYESKLESLQALVGSKATLTLSLDARDLLLGGGTTKNRLGNVGLNVSSLRHTFNKRIGNQTSIQITSRVGQTEINAEEDIKIVGNRVTLLRGNVIGIINHQYSPTKRVQVKSSIYNLFSPTVMWMHEDKLNSIRLSAPLSTQQKGPPPITISLRRRLFPSSLTLGSLEVTLNRQAPIVNVSIIKPPVISRKRTGKSPTIETGWTAGLGLRSVLRGGPSAYIQYSAIITKLSLALTTVLEYGLLTGPACSLQGGWSDEELGSEVGAQVVCNLRGVLLKLNFDYLGQSIVFPITLADSYVPGVALAATLVPATMFAFADYYFLRARRAAKSQQRKEISKLALQEQREFMHAEAKKTEAMLREVARRTREAEQAQNGLIITEARYFPIEDSGAPITDISIDVTIPIQALVHNSQLIIPGGRSKSILQGFYDPLPEFDKRLSVRYEFRGREHYAEVSENAPLLLPLESHVVEGKMKL